MICVAICDDTPGIRDLLGQYFRRFGKENQLPLSVDAYECGNQLLAADYLKYDLLILDVQMGEPNGIETARCIRKAGGSMVIIFFTNYVQYALEGYEVQAFRFLLKPLTYEQFSDVAGNALLQMQRMRQESLNIHQKDSVIRVPLADILYIETERGHVVVHTKSHETIMSGQAMKEVESALADHHFFRCHTAFLVNMREIKKVTQQEVILQDGTTIPLSKHRKKEMKEVLALLWGDEFL